MKRRLNDAAIVCTGAGMGLLFGAFWLESTPLGLAGVWFVIAAIVFAELRDSRK